MLLVLGALVGTWQLAIRSGAVPGTADTSQAEKRVRAEAGQRTDVGGKYWWSVEFTPNPIDSSWSVRAVLPSVQGRAGGEDRPVMLWAQCRASTHETSVWVHYHSRVGTDEARSAPGPEYKMVTVRPGGVGGYTERWKVSPYAAQAVYAPNPVGLLLEMAHAPQLVLELKLGRWKTVRTLWNTTGTARYLQQLAQKCRWKF